jgi:Arc/MetJ family transcription regulator
MANAWREHVKKTMAEMKSKAKGGKIMLRDVLKQAGKTYKKAGKAAASGGKSMKKKRTVKRRKSSKKR